MKIRLALVGILVVVLSGLTACGYEQDPLTEDFYTLNVYPSENNTYVLGDVNHTWLNGNFVDLAVSANYTQHQHYPVEYGKKGVANPPTDDEIGNTFMLAMTVDNDEVYFHVALPVDYAGDGINFYIEWTNDGGVDDLNKWTKWELNYALIAEGNDVSSSSASSPKTIADQYTSNAGWICNYTNSLTISEAEFLSSPHGFHIKIKAIDASGEGVVLTCEPRLISVALEYTAYKVVP